MSASLVGSEMCIRDSSRCSAAGPAPRSSSPSAHGEQPQTTRNGTAAPRNCLLYTSDAADDM
eukprot:7536232-Alexandrium_andersonii.AAC.1